MISHCCPRKLEESVRTLERGTCFYPSLRFQSIRMPWTIRPENGGRIPRFYWLSTILEQASRINNSFWALLSRVKAERISLGFPRSRCPLGSILRWNKYSAVLFYFLKSCSFVSRDTSCIPSGMATRKYTDIFVDPSANKRDKESLGLGR